MTAHHDGDRLWRLFQADCAAAQERPTTGDAEALARWLDRRVTATEIYRDDAIDQQQPNLAGFYDQRVEDLQREARQLRRGGGRT